nr:phytanoyl-CoA dioxygenase family protein [Paenacidovorax monticola]
MGCEPADARAPGHPGHPVPYRHAGGARGVHLGSGLSPPAGRLAGRAARRTRCGPRPGHGSAGSGPHRRARGDLIIWHHALPHGSRPNTTRQPRLVQYINLFPADAQVQENWV